MLFRKKYKNLNKHQEIKISLFSDKQHVKFRSFFSNTLYAYFCYPWGCVRSTPHGFPIDAYRLLYIQGLCSKPPTLIYRENSNICNRGNLQIEKRFFWQLHLKNPELINLKHYFIFRAVSSFFKVTFKVRILLGLNLLTMGIKKSLKFYTEKNEVPRRKDIVLFFNLFTCVGCVQSQH